MSFSAYMPSIKEVSIGTKYVTNGVNNENYKMFNDAYDDSVTNSACINDITNLLVGNGLVNLTPGGHNPSINISFIDTMLIALDYEKQGACTLEITWGSGNSVAKIQHMPIETTAINLTPEMKITGYWYSYDWIRKFKYTPVLYPVFDGKKPEGGINIMRIVKPSSEPLFPKPHWFAALRWAQDEGLLAQHSYRDVKTGFAGKKVINWVGGRGLTGEAKKQLAKDILSKFTGIDGEDTIVSVNDSLENSVVIDNISPPNVNATYVNYTEESERKILIANSYPAILLSGSKTGFSSNADEIVVATKSLFRRKIHPDRRVLLSQLQLIYNTIGDNIKLDFEDFKDEESIKELGEDSSNLATVSQGETTIPITNETAKAQAQLKGSVGGVQALLDIQSSFAAGTTTYESAISMLDVIFGYDRVTAVRLLGSPQKTNAII
tara:strand:+ start:3201 stop:4508 length:1308 start_codon:yes stop_codon:yes gene_type:complete